MSSNALVAVAAVAAVAVAAEGTALQQIDRNISYIRTVGKNVQERIQLTGLMILEHAAAHGDCTRALKLVQAMPKGLRRSLVVKWFERFSPIAVQIVDKSPEKSSVRFHKADSKRYNPFNIAGARAVPWYTIEPEQMPDVLMDLDAVNGKVINLADLLAKRLTDNKVGPAAVGRTTALIAALRAA